MLTKHYIEYVLAPTSCQFTYCSKYSQPSYIFKAPMFNKIIRLLIV